MKINNLSTYIASKKIDTENPLMPLDLQFALITHYIHNRNTQFEKYFLKGKELLNSILGQPVDADITEEQCDSFIGSNGSNYKPSKEPIFSFIDLFAGIGGFRLAMQQWYGKCVFSSEFNPNAQKTYSFNYGELPFGDITKEETKNLIPENFDVLCAGFPCQAFSIAGYRKGFEDTRGTLFFDVADIIRKHQPKVAYLENVRNLESHDNGKTFEVICNTLKELGYVVYHKVLNAADYGNIPQHRERIIIVAFNSNKIKNHSDFRFPEPIELTTTIHDFIDYSKKPEKYYYRETQKYYPQLIKDMTNPDTVYQWRRVYCRGNKSNQCPTLTANMGGGGHNVPLIITNDGIRKFTPKECLNFMGFPESFSFPTSIAESAMYMQAGNSVVVPMMSRVAQEIIKVLVNQEI